MPDIAMCYGEVVGGSRVCPKRERCYRYTASPTPRRQSYFAVLPAKDDGTCEYHIPTLATTEPQ